MKIAFIGSRGFPGFNAGVEKSLEELCPRLAAQGHEVTLYCSDKVTTQDKIYKNTISNFSSTDHHFRTGKRKRSWDFI